MDLEEALRRAAGTLQLSHLPADRRAAALLGEWTKRGPIRPTLPTDDQLAERMAYAFVERRLVGQCDADDELARTAVEVALHAFRGHAQQDNGGASRADLQRAGNTLARVAADMIAVDGQVTVATVRAALTRWHRTAGPQPGDNPGDRAGARSRRRPPPDPGALLDQCTGCPHTWAEHLDAGGCTVCPCSVPVPPWLTSTGVGVEARPGIDVCDGCGHWWIEHDETNNPCHGRAFLPADPKPCTCTARPPWAGWFRRLGALDLEQPDGSRVHHSVHACERCRATILEPGRLEHVLEHQRIDTDLAREGDQDSDQDTDQPDPTEHRIREYLGTFPPPEPPQTRLLDPEGVAARAGINQDRSHELWTDSAGGRLARAAHDVITAWLPDTGSPGPVSAAIGHLQRVLSEGPEPGQGTMPVRPILDLAASWHSRQAGLPMVAVETIAQCRQDLLRTARGWHGVAVPAAVPHPAERAASSALAGTTDRAEVVELARTADKILSSTGLDHQHAPSQASLQRLAGALYAAYPVLCRECLSRDEDPAPWCDCRPGVDGWEGPCAGVCKQRAHTPIDCPTRAGGIVPPTVVMPMPDGLVEAIGNLAGMTVPAVVRDRWSGLDHAIDRVTRFAAQLEQVRIIALSAGRGDALLEVRPGDTGPEPADGRLVIDARTGRPVDLVDSAGTVWFWRQDHQCRTWGYGTEGDKHVRTVDEYATHIRHGGATITVRPAGGHGVNGEQVTAGPVQVAALMSPPSVESDQEGSPA